MSDGVDRRLTRDGEVVTVRSGFTGQRGCFDVVSRALIDVIPEIEGRGTAKHTTLVIRAPRGLTPIERRAIVNSAAWAGILRVVLLDDAA